MADHGIVKQRKEKECWENAIQYSVAQKCFTRRILHSFVGEYIERKNTDSPDLVYRIENTKESFVLGIEHFMIDQASESKGSRVESKREEYKSYINRLLSSDAADKDILPEVAEKIYEIARENNEKDYNDLMTSFKYAFSKHNSRVEDYCCTLNELSGTSSYKLVFLIEIKCYLPHLYLNDGKTIRENHPYTMPICKEFVEELEKIDKGVDFIVLYYPDHNAVKDSVILIDAKNIRNSLRKQGIQIYEYCEGSTNVKFEKLQNTFDQNGLVMNYNCTAYVNGEEYMETIAPYLQKALEFIKQGIPFVAPRDIESFLCAYGKELSFKKNGEKIQLQLRGLTKAEALQRLEAFSNKFPIQEKDA